ncbi:MAG: hypothetical protein PUP91_35755, partial [Rhizonema sp. PD37]|nr:hypothetical protein [Rhizonema sp. PD37]
NLAQRSPVASLSSPLNGYVGLMFAKSFLLCLASMRAISGKIDIMDFKNKIPDFLKKSGI